MLNQTHKILRLNAVTSRTGLSRSSIYEQISRGFFPRPISLGKRSVGWLDADVNNWIEERIEASRRDSRSYDEK